MENGRDSPKYRENGVDEPKRDPKRRYVAEDDDDVPSTSLKRKTPSSSPSDVEQKRKVPVHKETYEEDENDANDDIPHHSRKRPVRREADQEESRQIVAKAAADLNENIDKYTSELNVKPKATTKTTSTSLITTMSQADATFHLDDISNINPKLYMIPGYIYLQVPTDKYTAYSQMTDTFGYKFDDTNNFLLNGGIMDVLRLERPFFSFWEHGLTIFMTRMNMQNDRTKQFLFKRQHCIEHPFMCKRAETDCRYEIQCSPGSSMSYMFAGVFRSYKSQFTSYFIELDNANKIEASGFNIAPNLTVKSHCLNVYVLNKCTHVACGVGKGVAPFPGMPIIYQMCSAIERQSLFREEFNGKRCYAYGKGISGTFHEKSQTIYLTSWNLTDLFILNS